MLLDVEPREPIDLQQAATSHLRALGEAWRERDIAEAKVERLRDLVDATAPFVRLPAVWPTSMDERMALRQSAWDAVQDHGDLTNTDDEPAPPAPRCPHCDALAARVERLEKKRETDNTGTRNQFINLESRLHTVERAYKELRSQVETLEDSTNHGDLTDAPEGMEVGG